MAPILYLKTARSDGYGTVCKDSLVLDTILYLKTVRSIGDCTESKKSGVEHDTVYCIRILFQILDQILEKLI